MKSNLLLVCAIVFASLASCTKESELDPSIVSALTSQTSIEFTTYASSVTATKGTAVNSNSEFQTGGSFDVSALVIDGDFKCEYDSSTNEISSCTATPDPSSSAVTYFNFISVNYSDFDTDTETDDKWVNSSNMYWPNYSKIITFAAYSPASVGVKDGDYTFSYTTDDNSVATYEYSFDYTVTNTVKDQIDLMYAMTSVDYLCPTDRYKQVDSDGTQAEGSYVTVGVGDTNNEDPVNLHFKHALTQIAFTATKDVDIDVYVKSIKVCNIYNSGTFTATATTDDVDSTGDEDSTEADTDLDTVGNSDLDGDKVDAGNFGTWEISFAEDGWGELSTQSKNYGTAYYTITGHTSMSHYDAPFAEFTKQSPSGTTADSIQIADDGVTTLTSTDDVLMLMPQTLTAWIPTTASEPNFVGYYATDNTTDFVTTLYDIPVSSTKNESLSYLAIDCEIYHKGIIVSDAKIHGGYIFVPFETKDIAYSSANTDNKADNADEWLAGYKITYCLNFGGGYVVDEDNHESIPEPGCIPDTETYTLRTITYTTTIDDWVDVAAGSQDLGAYDTSTGEPF